MRRYRTAWLLLIPAVLIGCASKPAIVTHPSPKVDPWILEWRDPSVETPAWLSNGLIGVRINRDGTGSGLTAFDIEHYDRAGEEKLIPLPNPLACEIQIAGKKLDPLKSSTYRQSLDMRSATLLTEWDQEIEGQTVYVEASVGLALSRRLHQIIRVRCQKGSSIRVRSFAPGMINGASAAASTSTEGTFASNPLFIEHGVEGALNGQWRKNSDWLAFDGKSESDAFKVRRWISIPDELERIAFVDGPARPHPLADIEIDGPVEDQQAIRSFLYYLGMAVNPYRTVPVSPYCLSNTTYNGHVFWDADVWVFPALCFLDPDRAKTIPAYRLKMLKAARENHQEWLKAGCPTANGAADPIGRSPHAQKSTGAKFPWESSVTGKETVPGPSKFQDHITGSVAWTMAHAIALGLAPPNPLVKQAAEFLWMRSERPGDEREIKATMSPDENHIGDNDLYTNLLAQWCNDHTMRSDLGWNDWTISNRVFKKPRDKISLLTYDNDPVRGYKQAAAVLGTYPLQYPEAEKQAKVMMDRFADKVTKNGPAMSDSIHALIWARLGEKEKAYETWHKSWKPFTNHPLMLFSEKRSKASTYFVTGAAGSLQTVLYGFLGFRIDSRKQPGAAWSTPLLGGNWLSIKPNLPKAWKKVTLRNFTVLGKKYTLTVDHNRVQVTQGDF